MVATRGEGGGGGGKTKASKPVRKQMRKTAPLRKKYAEGHANGWLPAKYRAERAAKSAASAPKPGYKTGTTAARGGISAATKPKASWINPTAGKKLRWP